MIGLSGAHRTGKTTLARAYAERKGIPFVETSTSAVWRSLGIDVSKPIAIEDRLRGQRAVLEAADALYAQYAGKLAVTDRTPIDFMAYTLADLNGQILTSEMERQVESYIADCFSILGRRFGLVVLVQPGIPLVHEPGKAALSKAYIEHLNSLMLGLMADPRNEVVHFYLSRPILELERRLSALEAATDRGLVIAGRDRDLHIEAGGFVH